MAQVLVKLDKGQERALKETLNHIRENAGSVSLPEAVVAAAQEETHPLHEYFVWDDAVAGHRFRVAQAGYLIRTVRLKLEKKETTTRLLQLVTEPVALRTPPPRLPEELPPEKVCPVEEAIRDVRCVIAKHSGLRELEDLWTTLSSVVDKLSATALQAVAIERSICNVLSYSPHTATELRRKLCPEWSVQQLQVVLLRLEAREVIQRGPSFLGEKEPQWLLRKKEQSWLLQSDT